jgi:hypothetical protein
MARVIRPSVLALLAAAAIIMALMLTGVLGGAGPSPAGAATAYKSGTHNSRAHRAAAEQQAAESESAGENESAAEPAGEAQPGHEDPESGQVDHQCPPDCAPGELP